MASAAAADADGNAGAPQLPVAQQPKDAVLRLLKALVRPAKTPAASDGVKKCPALPLAVLAGAVNAVVAVRVAQTDSRWAQCFG